MQKAQQKTFDLEVLNSSHKDIRRLKRNYPTSIHGNKFWSSSYLLMDYFTQNNLQAGTKVLELGCGWGLASIWLNKNQNTINTAVDADADVFPYLDLHASINNAQVETWQTRFEKITTGQLDEFDVVIAADVCFWDELTRIHFNLIRRALKAGVEKIIYADPEREPFLELAQMCSDKLFADIHEVDLTPDIKAHGGLMVIENA